jgi:hypothetical protein
MTSEFVALCLTAVCVGVVHTAAGPDHSIPFVAMARAGGWSAAKTFWVTAACGLGHVAGSAVLGIVGLTVGSMVLGGEALEALRGDIASSMLIGLGMAYFAWGLMRAVGGHAAGHAHGRFTGHAHGPCRPEQPIAGGHDPCGRHHRPTVGSWTPWMLFLIFVFGPSEPLVPLLMVPASRSGPVAVAAVVTAFACATVVTMTSSVMLMRYGTSLVPGPLIGRFDQAVAGLAMLACGVLVKFGL